MSTHFPLPRSASRHFLFALTDGGGTVPPELGVVRRLVRRGHRVRVLAEESMAADVLAAGAELHLWTRPNGQLGAEPEHSAYRDWEIRSPLGLARGMADHMLAGPARRLAQETIAEAEADPPNSIVTSFVAFGAMAAAEALGLPFAVLIPNLYPMPITGVPPMGMGLRPARTPVERVRDRTLNAMGTRLLGHYVLPRLNTVRRELGLPGLRTHWDQVHAAERQLVLSSRAFEFPAHFPATVRHMGPILDEPAWASPGAWSAPAGEAPLVLVALSSTYQGQRESVQNVIEALAGLPVRGLVSLVSHPISCVEATTST